jgi:transcriptional regulator
MPDSYLHYLTASGVAEAEVAASQRRRAPHEAELIPSAIGVTIHEDSDFIAENFPDGIPSEIHKNTLSIKDSKIVALHAAGYKNIEIAEMIGVTKEDVSLILRHPSSKKIIEELAQKLLKDTINTVKSNYVAHADEAFRATLKLMRHSKNDRVKLEAARDITKAAGVLDERSSDGKTPIDPESAKIISATLKELAEETKEFNPLGNSADLDTIRAELDAAEEIEAVIEETRIRT